MKLTRLGLGFVLATGLFLLGTACGSSDSSNNGNNPGGGGGGSGGGGSGGGGSAGGSSGGYSSGDMTCKDIGGFSCKNGSIAVCCNSSQCKISAAGKDFVCSGMTTESCDSAINAAASYCAYTS